MLYYLDEDQEDTTIECKRMYLKPNFIEYPAIGLHTNYS